MFAHHKAAAVKKIDNAMLRHVDYLLIGGGLASATAAEALRDGGANGSILILGNEDVLAYNRPPLSKQLLRGTLRRENVILLDERKCLDTAIEVLLGCAALAIDPQRQVVVTSRGI